MTVSKGFKLWKLFIFLLYIPAIRYFVQWNPWWIASLWTGQKPERRIFFFCRMYLPPGPNEWKGILLYWISHIPRNSCLMCWYIHHRCLCLYWNKLSSYCKIINLCVLQFTHRLSSLSRFYIKACCIYCFKHSKCASIGTEAYHCIYLNFLVRTDHVGLK